MRERCRGWSLLLCYGAGALAAGVAIWIRYLLDPWMLDEGPFASVVIAVPLVAWLFGTGPAILSLALGVLAADYCFVDPRGSFYISGFEHHLGCAFAILFSLVVIALIHLLYGSKARAEQDKKTTEARDAQLRLALRAANMGSWEWDIGSDRLSADEKCRELFGFAAEEAITGELFLTRIVERDRSMVERRLEEASVKPGEYEVEFRVQPSDEIVRWILSRGRSIRQNERSFIGGVAVDVTSAKRVEEELRRHERQLQEEQHHKDAFLATLAHELRNPLSALTAVVETLARPTSLESNARLTSALRDRTKQLSRLVEDLLDISRIARGKIKLKKEQTDLGNIIQRAVESLRGLIEERRHQLSVTLPPDPLPVYGDPVRLEQVIANLLHNAAKYTRDGGRIAVWVSRSNGWLETHVKDNGVGIHREMLPKIFDLFEQAEGSLHLAHGGLGIGLTLVRRLTQIHNGEVTAYSEGPGKGSEFVLRLPEAQAPAAAQAV